MDAGKMCPCQLGWPRELGLRFVHLVRISPKLLPSVVERVEVGDGVGRTAAVFEQGATETASFIGMSTASPVMLAVGPRRASASAFLRVSDGTSPSQYRCHSFL
jgi:hypothetical protein